MLTNIVSDMMRDSRLVSEFAQNPEQFLESRYPGLSARARRALVSRSLAETLRTINQEIEEYLAGAHSPALRYGGLPELVVKVSPSCGPVGKGIELKVVMTVSTGVLPSPDKLKMHFEFSGREVHGRTSVLESSATRLVFSFAATFPLEGSYQLVVASTESSEPYVLDNAFHAHEE